MPFLDLARTHGSLLERFVESFREVATRNAFVNGAEVRAFEEAFASWVGTRYALGCSSGLDAQVIMLRAAGLRPGDRVLVPAQTFIATVESVTWAGAEPILVDVDENGLMDLEQADDLAARTGARAIFPVHLFGHMIDPDALAAIASRHDLLLFEDACQAHGARRAGRRAGSIGIASSFSFYPGKNLGALGDAGAMVTDSADVLRVATALREHGQTAKYYHEYEGYTARIDTIQAAFLGQKLPCADMWNGLRVAAAERYASLLDGIPGLTLQATSFDGSHVYHLFVVLSDRRDRLIEAFKANDIGYGLHYPIAIHELPCYRGKPWAEGQYPMAERYASTGISLPMFPGIRDDELRHVADVVRDVHAR